MSSCEEKQKHIKELQESLCDMAEERNTLREQLEAAKAEIEMLTPRIWVCRICKRNNVDPTPSEGEE